MAPVLTKNPISDEDTNSSKHHFKQLIPYFFFCKNFKHFLYFLDDQEPRRKKKRASRWAGTESDKAVIPGIPTIMPANMTSEQEKAYLSKSYSQPKLFVWNRKI